MSSLHHRQVKLADAAPDPYTCKNDCANCCADCDYGDDAGDDRVIENQDDLPTAQIHEETTEEDVNAAS